MKTVTFSNNQLAAVKSALEERIEEIKESASLIDTDYANDPVRKAHFHMFYADQLDVARQAFDLMVG
jgi:hypothetical protein